MLCNLIEWFNSIGNCQRNVDEKANFPTCFSFNLNLERLFCFFFLCLNFSYCIVQVDWKQVIDIYGEKRIIHPTRISATYSIYKSSEFNYEIMEMQTIINNIIIWISWKTSRVDFESQFIVYDFLQIEDASLNVNYPSLSYSLGNTWRIADDRICQPIIFMYKIMNWK